MAWAGDVLCCHVDDVKSCRVMACLVVALWMVAGGLVGVGELGYGTCCRCRSVMSRLVGAVQSCWVKRWDELASRLSEGLSRDGLSGVRGVVVSCSVDALLPRRKGVQLSGSEGGSRTVKCGLGVG